MKLLTKEELRNVQLIELDILIEFDRICRKNNIKYTLAGGTLLGAIRHNGFIPWDDDIDVSMLRKDYDKFLKVQEKELKHEKYVIEAMDISDDCWRLYAKLKRKNTTYSDIASNRSIDEQQIWIDIFPIDNIKNNNFFSKLYYMRVYILKILMMYKSGYIKSSNDKRKNKLVKYIKIISKFYNINSLKRRLNKYIQKYNNLDTDYLACFAGVYARKEIVKKEYYYNGIEEHLFENNNFYILKEYDKYLTHFYGDYMQLPPAEQRIGHHYTNTIKFPNEK